MAMVVALVLAIAPAAADAKGIEGFIGGPNGGGAGQFTAPRDVAVFEGVDGDTATDKIFVVGAAVSDDMRVDRLDRDGNFELRWGRGVDASQPGSGYEVCVVAADCRAPGFPLATGSLKGEFDDPSGLAVDQVGGWVYVYDRDNRRVQKFDLDGNFILAFGKGVNQTTGGDVCTEASGDTCGAGVTGSGAGQLATTPQQVRGLAVSPVSGSVFVSDPTNRRVLQFSSSGVFERGWGWDVDKTDLVGNRFETCTTICGAGATSSSPSNANGWFGASQPLHLAVDSNGIVYASDSAPGSSAQRVIRFDSDPAPAGPGDAGSALAAAIASPPLFSAGTTPTVGLEIDGDSDAGGPDEEHLLVARDPGTSGQPTVVQEFDIPTVPTDPILAAQLVATHTYAVNQAINGLGVSAGTGNIYLPAFVSAATVGVFVLADTGGSPVPAPLAPTSVGTTTATLAGTVNGGGGNAPVTYRFEISSDGSVYTPVGDSPGYVSGSSPTPVSQGVSGLDPNSFYRVRIVATRQTGLNTTETVTSSEEIFLTDSAPPDVTTLPVGPRTDTTAQLRGSVDPNGTSTNYWFEYGPDTTYGTRVPLVPAGVGAGNEPVSVLEDITGLLPGTTYHYRIVADGFGSAVAGIDRVFTTHAGSRLDVPAAGDPLGRRAFELVSPADKIAGIGVGPWYQGPGTAAYAGIAAQVGDRFAASGDMGSMLLDGAQGYVSDWAFAERGGGGQGWLSHSPITHAASAAQDYRWIHMQAATPDLSRVTWRSNGGLLRPFPEMGGWDEGAIGNLSFLGDWAGRWEIFGPTDPDTQAVGNSTAAIDVVLSDDGSTAAGSTSTLRGLAGPGDPTLGLPAGASIRNVYVADVGGQLADGLPGTGARVLASACSGGTVVPAIDGAGDLLGEPCADGALVSQSGAAQQRGVNNFSATTSLDGVVSDDGSRLFFMSPDPRASGVPNGSSLFCDASGETCPAQLFVRQERGDGEAVSRWISRSRSQDLGGGRFGGAPIAGQDASLLGQALFEGASDDGDKVFFRSNSPLTPDDPNGGVQVAGGVTSGSASSSSWDLFMYDFPDGPGADPADGTLTRVSAGPTGASDANNPQSGDFAEGSLRFVSAEGAMVYFVTAAPLAGVAAAADGTVTAPGGGPSSTDRSNLYVFDASKVGAERWRFVARLPRSIGLSPATCATTGTGDDASPLLPQDSRASGRVEFSGVRPNCVKGTSDGGFVTLFTNGRLTVDDPDDVSGDIYGYDADRDELTRLTAPKGGVGGSYPCGTQGVAAATPCNGDVGFDNAEVFSRAPNPSLGVVTDPAVKGDRVAFFQSRSRLVAQDTDSAYDVYQWRNGDLSLLTPGDSAADEGQMYKGNDASGRNVYFATMDRMSWQDFDSVLDIYVARAGGGIAQPAPPVLCATLAGGCHGGAAATVTPVVGSKATTTGNRRASTRAVLSVAVPGKAARRRAARRGVLALRVRSTGKGRVRAVARARIGKLRRVGRGSVRLTKPGAKTVRVRLSRVARSRLARGRGLALRVRVSSPDARARTITVRLPGVRS